MNSPLILLMNWRDHVRARALWQWPRVSVLLILPALLFFAGSGQAQNAQRIVSLNVCADILLVDLVERSRIVALSRNALDPRLNPAPEKMAGHALAGRSAESVFALKPDLVLAGAFAGRDAKAFLSRQGIPVVNVGIANSLDDVAEVILQTGHALGVEEKARQIAQSLDRPAPVQSQRRRALSLERRGVVSGRKTLMDDLMQRAGLENAAPFDGYAILDVERLLQIEADLIILNTPPGAPSDQGQALLQHPALKTHFARAQTVVVPGNLTVCASPHVAKAVDLLRDAAREHVRETEK